MTNNFSKYSTLLSLVGPISVIIIWEFVAIWKNGSELYFASPQETVIAMISFLKTSDTYFDILYTLGRTIISVLISILLAVPVALFITLRRSFYIISQFNIDFFRSIPSTALFPLFLVAFGLNDAARISTAVFISFWIILLNLSHGIAYASKIKIDALTIMGASKFQIFKHVVLWESLSYLFSGIKLAVSTSLVIIIITEMLVSPIFGLGTRIFYMQQTYKIPHMYALIIFTGLLGYFISKLVLTIEQKIVHWT